MRQAIWILWPSFLTGGLANTVFFTLVDPMSLTVFEHMHDYNRLGIYSLGFFFFWAFGAMSSALTCFFQRSAEEINRCPLTPPQRPPGCPKRDEDGACC